jgi:hypothetical protein
MRVSLGANEAQNAFQFGGGESKDLLPYSLLWLFFKALYIALFMALYPYLSS